MNQEKFLVGVGGVPLLLAFFTCFLIFVTPQLCISDINDHKQMCLHKYYARVTLTYVNGCKQMITNIFYCYRK